MIIEYGNKILKKQERNSRFLSFNIISATKWLKKQNENKKKTKQKQKKYLINYYMFLPLGGVFVCVCT